MFVFFLTFRFQFVFQNINEGDVIEKVVRYFRVRVNCLKCEFK